MSRGWERQLLQAQQGGDVLALTCLHRQVTVELVQHGHHHILVLGLAELQGTERDRDTHQQCHGDSGSAAQTPDRTTALEPGSVLHHSPRHIS